MVKKDNDSGVVVVRFKKEVEVRKNERQKFMVAIKERKIKR